jgi:hypothetical protein
MNGLGGHGSLSIAYKSLLFSVTASGGNEGEFLGGLLTNHSSQYQFQYFGITAGQALRFKNGLISLSAGLGLTNLDLTLYNPKTMTNNNYVTKTVSVPIEFRIFLLAYYNLGIGLTFNEDLIPKTQYSPSLIGACIVLGNWNHYNEHRQD